MKKKLLALFMGTSLILAACSGGDDAKEKEADSKKSSEETTTANAGDAQKFYDQKCAACHGGEIEQVAGLGADLTKEEIEDIIINGRGSMPKGLLKDEEAAVVAEWLVEQK